MAEEKSAGGESPDHQHLLETPAETHGLRSVRTSPASKHIYAKQAADYATESSMFTPSRRGNAALTSKYPHLLNTHPVITPAVCSWSCLGLRPTDSAWANGDGVVGVM